MVPEKITSLQNPRVKQLVKLRDRRPRDEAGVFLVEGYREIRRALEKQVKLTELYFSPEWFLGENEPALIEQARAAGAQVIRAHEGHVCEGRLSRTSRRVAGRGSAVEESRSLTWTKLWVGVYPRQVGQMLGIKPNPHPLSSSSSRRSRSRGGLGTILRSADAAGCDGVIVCDAVTDIFNPNVVRASTGVLFSVHHLWWLRAAAVRVAQGESKIRIIATTPAAETLYTSADLRGPLAVVMGSEQYGLSGVLAEERRPAGADPDGGTGGFTECRDGDDYHAV